MVALISRLTIFLNYQSKACFSVKVFRLSRIFDIYHSLVKKKKNFCFSHATFLSLYLKHLTKP